MKILIIRLSSIGDIVLTTPVIRCLHQQLPQAEIHFLTKPAYTTLLEGNPYVQRIHTWQDSLKATYALLKQEAYDAIIDLHNNLRSRLICGLLQTPAYHFPKLNFEKWWLVHTGKNILPPQHIVDRYLEAANWLNIRNDGAGLDYFIPEGTRLPVELPAAYLVVAIGAQHGTKRIPDNKLIEIITGTDGPVMLIGGTNERPSGEAVVEACGSRVVNLCGNLSIHQSALLMKQAHRVLSNDTGMMHIAAALKKEVVSVWGNTLPEFGMYPYYGNRAIWQQQFEVKGLDCRPCSKIGFERCPKGHFHCMTLQDAPGISRSLNARH